MDTAGQHKHLFILESCCAEILPSEKIDSGMYTNALNTVGVREQGRGAEGGRVETLTASIQDVRIFLMPSDMAGIYNRGGELTRPAVTHSVPKLQLHRFGGEVWELSKHLKTIVSRQDSRTYSVTYKLDTSNSPSHAYTTNPHLPACSH